MRKNKAEQARSEYLPKIKAFMSERVFYLNAKRIYDFLKAYQYDKGGWLLWEAAKGILESDVYSEFPAEDNMGYFEDLDGYGLLPWLEIAKFADKEYEQLPGDYEKLAAYTLDENLPEYKEYQNRVYLAALRSIAVTLGSKRPHQLEGFWHSLARAENMLGKGFPTRGDLSAKLDREAENLTGASGEKAEGREYSECEAKQAICRALRETAMTDYMTHALFLKSDVLGEAYKFYTEESENEQIHLAVWEYLDKTEHAYLVGRVSDRLNIEYEDYTDEARKMPPEKIIDETWAMNDFRSIFEPETSHLSTEQLKALMSLDSPLKSLCGEWQRQTHIGGIKDVIAAAADERAAETETVEFGGEFEDEGDWAAEP
ncbi:MAG: DUF3848 domain-containing protein [Gracilibacteraceae bacterium]|jgi:hypothetical protein|nr:DUF3848 domain-containing protein [Gracilibacteraceae bacterium]